MDDMYNEFPVMTIGGPTGDYSLACPMTSCEHAEYMVMAVVNGDGGVGAVFVSGDSAEGTKTLKYDGTITLQGVTGNGNSFVRGLPFRLTASQTLPPVQEWQRITNSEMKVYARIDAAANTSMYVAIKFRVKVLKNLPAKIVTVDPLDSHQANVARAKMTAARLNQEVTVHGQRDRVKR